MTPLEPALAVHDAVVSLPLVQEGSLTGLYHPSSSPDRQRHYLYSWSDFTKILNPAEKDFTNLRARRRDYILEIEWIP